MKQYTAKTEEEAIALACQDKNCKPENLYYYILKQQNGFIFNIGGSTTIEAYTREDVKEFIFNYLGTYFEHLNLAVSIEIFLQEKDTYSVVLDSEKNALIIGRGGQTLRCFGNVLKAAVNTEFKASIFHKPIRIYVDVNNYRFDRHRKVEIMAKRIAKEVSHSHIDASLDPLPADERKVVHQVLNNYPHISTCSEGEGSARHVVIRYNDKNKEVAKNDN